MLYLACLPYAAGKALEASLYAYGGVKVLGLDSKDTAFEEEESSSEVSPTEENIILCALPQELFTEVLVMLEGPVYTCALRVSRKWYKTLNHELLWERRCRWQWPGVAHNVPESWREFAMAGGGDMLGAYLLQHLRDTQLPCITYPAQCCLVESQGVCCDACGVTNPHGMRVRQCRSCSYNRCDKCYKALQPPAAITNGAANHKGKNGWSSLHYACRLGFKDVVQRLLDARIDVECRDEVHGYTPLMVGASHGRVEICRLLLQHGAKKDSVNHYAKTAADCAHSWGHDELKKLLVGELSVLHDAVGHCLTE